MSKGFLLAGIALIALTGCDLAPDYKKPDVAQPQAYKESGDWATAAPDDTSQRGPWWTVFNDPKLNELEDGVTNANQNLKIALAQYQEARAAATNARSAYFPTVTGGLSAARQHVSTAVANVEPSPTFNDFSFGADLTYEVDLWGRVRNAVTAQENQAQASAADLAGVSLSMHAEMAEDYFALRADDVAQDILDETVLDDQKAMELTLNLYHGGAAPESDYDQAEAQLENARTQDADMRLQRAQIEHAIAILVGKAPADFSLPPTPLNATLTPINPGLPSVLLERRPDVAAAERRASSANAEIGVARAVWFPTINLTGTLGYETSSIQNWLTSPANYWSLGPSAVMTLFDAGAINALNDQARAGYDEAVASYRLTVLEAYQEVEDNLAALHHLSDESKTQAAAKMAADRTLDQANARYFNGATTYLDVVTAQNLSLQARLGVVTILMRQLTAETQLIVAMGGGWDPKDLDKVNEEIRAHNTIFPP